ncbi:MAG: hypothetical protein K9W45_00625 [Candidatus Heimdallarchaeum aukensis]|uniref:Uncharacterized protein n=1 Tax=Candidatus Heimdallarchaeum aukensis TaxID=2876573 RepID=A0A9Y1FLM0_9ARCH|nr:MAG: hypothetical protein K9W45_00625 [Candidatus Heimdallarchaeum aukensis]
MTIHVQYLSQVIVRMKFEGDFDDKLIDELDRCLDEQIGNTQKQLFYLIDLSSYDKITANNASTVIADKLAERGDIIANVAFLGQKKIKIKNKDIKAKSEVFTSDFSAQNWISDKSRHGFLDHISVKSLLDR